MGRRDWMSANIESDMVYGIEKYFFEDLAKFIKSKRRFRFIKFWAKNQELKHDN